ncbi:hypothetical protein [Nocardia aurantia]|uniref:hypothetical protein n=1 Tax=Nocardia aurantia TaxID=2585199 RepID=UPI001296FBDA|nr:hypothetical protein [Nocardia aurantia]
MLLGFGAALAAYLLLHQPDPSAPRRLTLSASRTGSFTERYPKAVEQPGHQTAAIRIGGVTAPARIADDSQQDRSTCLTLLCTYLRTPGGSTDMPARPHCSTSPPACPPRSSPNCSAYTPIRPPAGRGSPPPTWL